MLTALHEGESLQKFEVANIQRGWEIVGGKLALTNERLIFESNVYDINYGSTVIELPEIADVQECWAQLLNLIPIMPNAIAITTKAGKEYRLVVYGRSAWIDAIKSCARPLAAN
ncbi:hypothetical protein [Singulisphaera sp. PoT]|uniref:hypothetical protein n=1 Tax=Singulisphaera sp. PoT TaxID=3411797 RepID=UPI003BF46FDA